MADLERPGIGFAGVAAQLEPEGIEKFIEPFGASVRHIREKSAR